MLTHQVSLLLPTTKQLIYDVVKKEPHIEWKLIKHQFEKLITEPTWEVTSSFLSTLPPKKPMVIVIDALNECNDKQSMLVFVRMLFELQKLRQLPFQVLVASGVEDHTQRKIDNSAAHGHS